MCSLTHSLTVLLHLPYPFTFPIVTQNCIFQNLHFNSFIKNIDVFKQSLYFSRPKNFNFQSSNVPKKCKKDICIVPYSVDLHHGVINCAFSSFHPEKSCEEITWFSRNHFNRSLHLIYAPVEHIWLWFVKWKGSHFRHCFFEDLKTLELMKRNVPKDNTLAKMGHRLR